MGMDGTALAIPIRSVSTAKITVAIIAGVCLTTSSFSARQKHICANLAKIVQGSIEQCELAHADTKKLSPPAESWHCWPRLDDGIGQAQVGHQASIKVSTRPRQ